MNKPNRIIALIDFSDYSERIVSFSAEFSQQIHAEVIFIHEVSGMVPAYADETLREQIITQEMEAAKEKMSSLLKDTPLQNSRVIITELDVISELQKTHDETHEDWVVLGLKGTGFIKEIFIGNTAIRVINHTKMLTVTIPLEKSISVPEELLVAVSPKYPLNHQQFELVLENLKPNLKHITFVSVGKNESDRMERVNLLENLCEQYASYKTNSILLEEGEIITQLLNMAETRERAFLVVQQGSRTLLDTVFRKYLVNQLVNYGATPLIVLSE